MKDVLYLSTILSLAVVAIACGIVINDFLKRELIQKTHVSYWHWDRIETNNKIFRMRILAAYTMGTTAIFATACIVLFC